jgi:hypothetical protein
MIDKNFYLENLSAFDILIEDDDRKQAEEVIFRVYSMLQRDKIWLRDVATEEEIIEEDTDFLQEVEEELKELDEKYEFHFDDFYKLVQQELKKMQSTSNGSLMEDEFIHLSDKELALVEDYILESAKTRFNYPEFLGTFPDADEIFVEEEFILPIIAGKAFGQTDIEIAGKMLSSFMRYGYPIEMHDLLKMIEKKGKELGSEILAFKIAADSLQQGAHPTVVVDQISHLLRD